WDQEAGIARVITNDGSVKVRNVRRSGYPGSIRSSRASPLGLMVGEVGTPSGAEVVRALPSRGPSVRTRP
ncbi:hypothetical protein ABTW96_19285, partial [Nocardia beijingensis]